MTKRARLLQKLRNVSASGAAFSDVVTLLESYGFKRLRTAGSHWVFVYTDDSGKRLTTVFPVQNGKNVKQKYVRDIVGLVDEVRGEDAD